MTRETAMPVTWITL